MRITLLILILASMPSVAQKRVTTPKPKAELLEIRPHMGCRDQCLVFAIWDHAGEPRVITMVCPTLYATCNDVEPGPVEAKRIPMNKECTFIRSLTLTAMTPEAQEQTLQQEMCLELATRPYPLVYWVEMVPVRCLPSKSSYGIENTISISRAGAGDGKSLNCLR
jgi:hypothetical protein